MTAISTSLKFDTEGQTPEFILNESIILSVPRSYWKSSFYYSLQCHLENIKEILKIDKLLPDGKDEYSTTFEFDNRAKCVIVIYKDQFKYSVIPDNNSGSFISFCVNYNNFKKDIDSFLQYLLDIEKNHNEDENEYLFQKEQTKNQEKEGGANKKRKH